MPPRAKQNARRTRARTIAELEEVTQTLETTLDGLRAAHAAAVLPQPARRPPRLRRSRHLKKHKNLLLGYQ